MMDRVARSSDEPSLTVIVPLAGPDFERPDGTVKADLRVDGKPLLDATLQARPWWGDNVVLVFVLRDTRISRAFAEDRLLIDYPNARIAWLSHQTSGAAWSCALGLSLAVRADSPVIVDLCDIVFETQVDIGALMVADRRLGGLAMTFDADDAHYSYLKLAPDGRVEVACEKSVISRHASAGVYVFRDAATFFEAFAYSLRHRETLSFQGALYVCPMLNGVVASGRDVRCVAVDNVHDIKIAALA